MWHGVREGNDGNAIWVLSLISNKIWFIIENTCQLTSLCTLFCMSNGKNYSITCNKTLWALNLLLIGSSKFPRILSLPYITLSVYIVESRYSFFPFYMNCVPLSLWALRLLPNNCRRLIMKRGQMVQSPIWGSRFLFSFIILYIASLCFGCDWFLFFKKRRRNMER